jgi:hypothetical protein
MAMFVIMSAPPYARDRNLRRCIPVLILASPLHPPRPPGAFVTELSFSLPLPLGGRSFTTCPTEILFRSAVRAIHLRTANDQCAWVFETEGAGRTPICALNLGGSTEVQAGLPQCQLEGGRSAQGQGHLEGKLRPAEMQHEEFQGG